MPRAVRDYNCVERRKQAIFSATSDDFCITSILLQLFIKYFFADLLKLSRDDNVLISLGNSFHSFGAEVENVLDRGKRDVRCCVTKALR